MANPAATPEPSLDDIDHFRAVLREIVDHGADITRCLSAQSKAEPIPHHYWGDKGQVQWPTEHLAACYDRVTRSVRRSIALALTLHQLPTHALHRVGAANDAHPRAPNPAPEPGDKPGATRESPDRPDWQGDWHEPGEDFAADATRPVNTTVEEIRLDYAALGHPLRPKAAKRPNPTHGKKEGKATTLFPPPISRGTGEGQSRQPKPTPIRNTHPPPK